VRKKCLTLGKKSAPSHWGFFFFFVFLEQNELVPPGGGFKKKKDRGEARGPAEITPLFRGQGALPRVPKGEQEKPGETPNSGSKWNQRALLYQKNRTIGEERGDRQAKRGPLKN